MTNMEYRDDCQRGSVLFITAILLTVVLGFTALAIDIGFFVLEKAKLQNAVDAGALAGGRELPNTAQAFSEAIQYVNSNDSEPGDISVDFTENNSKITVNTAKSVQMRFMSAFGIRSIRIDASATAMLAGPNGPFNYAIFSGSTVSNLNITGGGWTVKGSIHTNSNLNLTGGGSTITGAAEAAEQVKITGGGFSIGTIGNKAPVIEMPDLSANIASAAAACGQVYVGNKTITAGGFSLGNSMYVKGKVSITGGGFTSTGAILSDGDMNITGGGISINGSNQVCFYSKNGNITFTGGGGDFNGVLYAPNGRITITGGGCNFNGCIVAKEVVLTGGAINVNREDHPVKSIPSSHVKLIK